MTVRLRCPAKLNLHLEVWGRHRDGYHELRTLLATVGLWDELELADAPPGEFELEVHPVGAAPAGDDNLVLRAARRLAELAGGGNGARMKLSKHIPAGGGLGGGSSDAAATLVGLAALWHLRTSRAELGRLAAELGADVPFFLVGGVGWGVGRGSEVYPLPDLPGWAAVLLPGSQPIPTTEVYRLLQAGPVDSATRPALYHWIVAGGELPLPLCRNDLQPVVVRCWPEVGQRLSALSSTEPMLAMLSGSGSTVFGLYPGIREAETAADSLATAHAGLVVPLLPRAQACLRPSAEE